ncbi:MAG: uridine kinase [SAR324 cluster bacterium]|nr:uridine kinase [SAR324 cluster bacterium]MBL7034729.1 uridine kinase [SAR324 cluster bacterium]
MKIIAVTGGSGSGKSLFTKFLVKRLPNSLVLPLDSYYKDRPDHIPSDHYDFDTPQAFDFDLYYEHLNLLMSGKTVNAPHFGYKTGKRLSSFTELVPEKYLIMEGLHVLLDPDIREKQSFSFYMESPLDVAICRMCLRDIKNFEVTAEYRLNQYLKFVRPAFFKHIQPIKKFADLVVKNNYDSPLDLILDDILLENQL